MKLATTTWDFDNFCTSYADRVKAVAKAGFKYIDLSMYSKLCSGTFALK